MDNSAVLTLGSGRRKGAAWEGVQSKADISACVTRHAALNPNRPIGEAGMPTKHVCDMGPCWDFVTSDRWPAF
jgi:hypothetical protein